MALYEYYFNVQKEYEQKYGSKTITIIEVGSFMEVYRVENETETVGPDIRGICDICDLVLSRKNKAIIENNRANPMMAGFPTHAFSKHVQLLLNQQYTIIVIRQVTPPPNPKREITEILSPGIQITPNTTYNNYLFVSYWTVHKDTFQKRLLSVGISGIDVSTGETWIYEIGSTTQDPGHAMDELLRFYQMYQPREIVFLGSDVTAEERADIEDSIGIQYDNTRSFHRLWDYKNLTEFTSVKYQNEFLKKAYNDCKSMLSPIEHLNLETYANARVAFTYMIQFAYEHNAKLIECLKPPQLFTTIGRCILDYNSSLQLQIISNNNAEKPLAVILNRCSTAFGSRHFHEILLQPFTDPEYIQSRYNRIETLIQSSIYITIHSYLKQVVDIQRIGRRMLLGQYLPNEWPSFDSSMTIIKELCEFMKTTELIYKQFSFDLIEKITHDIIAKYTCILNITECAKYNTNDVKNNIFQSGVYTEIDSLDAEFRTHYNLLKEICDIFQETSRIDNNDRDGYFITMTKKRWETVFAQLNKNHCTIKLANGEVLKMGDFKAKPVSTASTVVRIHHPFIEKESDVLIKITSKISYIVQTKYKEFLKDFSHMIKDDLSSLIQYITDIDISVTNTRNAIDFNYIKPTIGFCENVATNKNEKQAKSYVRAIKLRHPILERIINKHEYIPNDISLGCESVSVGAVDGLLLFGMNASGKSSLMKAIGLGVIMAQAGMYVPAQSFEYIPYDTIFTRISGADNIYRGWSSFTVEMMELRNILQRCNERSLVLGDELCSGTESISALAIVTAGIDALIKKRTSFVFATHLHDLSKLATIKAAAVENGGPLRLAHMHVEVDKTNGRLIFDRQLREGTGSSLYGLEVCYGLNLPTEFLQKAHEIRCEIEDMPTLLMTPKTSHYNHAVFVGDKCGVCKVNKSTETHHIKEQQMANDYGFIDHFHKNKSHNLIPLCDECHDKVHHGNLVIHGYKDTTEGQILDFEFTFAAENNKNNNKNVATFTEQKTTIIDSKNKHSNIKKSIDLDLNKVKTYLMYNKGKWYNRKAERYAWKEIQDTEKLHLMFIKYLKLSKEDIDNDEVIHEYQTLLQGQNL